MITVKINDEFPGSSKNTTKTLPDEIAKELITKKWATEVKEKPLTAAQLRAQADAEAKAKQEAEDKAKAETEEKAKAEAEAKAKEDAEADARKDKTDKDASGIETK